MSVRPGLGARNWNGRQLAQEELTAVTMSITVTVMVNVFETTIGLFICRPLPNIHSRIQFIFKWLCFLYPQPKWWDFKFNLLELHPFTMSDEQRFKQAWNTAAMDIWNVFALILAYWSKLKESKHMLSKDDHKDEGGKQRPALHGDEERRLTRTETHLPL